MNEYLAGPKLPPSADRDIPNGEAPGALRPLLAVKDAGARRRRGQRFAKASRLPDGVEKRTR
jgi:hypothetical protein